MAVVVFAAPALPTTHAKLDLDVEQKAVLHALTDGLVEAVRSV